VTAWPATICAATLAGALKVIAGRDAPLVLPSSRNEQGDSAHLGRDQPYLAGRSGAKENRPAKPIRTTNRIHAHLAAAALALGPLVQSPGHGGAI